MSVRFGIVAVELHGDAPALERLRGQRADDAVRGGFGGFDARLESRARAARAPVSGRA